MVELWVERWVMHPVLRLWAAANVAVLAFNAGAQQDRLLPGQEVLPGVVGL